MSELKRWVSDSLHRVLGYSESHLTDYVLSLAKQSKSSSALLAKLEEANVPASETTRRFAAELFSRVPRSRWSAQVATMTMARTR
jgi:hypothetical protein